MNSETYDLYFHQVLNYVFTEEKIVTYKWLSQKFKINVNVTKEFLKQFVKDVRSTKNNCELSVIYWIFGRLNENEVNCSLVSETSLEDTRKRFEKVECEHIYSIQKESNNLDYNALYTVDKPVKDFSLGRIKIGRDITKIDSRPQPVAPEKPTPIVAPKTENETKKEPEKKTGSLSNMFKNQAKKNLDEALDEANPKKDLSASETEKKPTATTKPQVKPKGGITNFFSKGPKPTPKPPLTNQNKEVPKPKSPEKSKEESPKRTEPVKKSGSNGTMVNRLKALVDSDDDEEIEVKENKKESPKPKKQRKKNTANKRTRSNDKSDQAAKKRKRIQVESDSSEDDIFETSRTPSPVVEDVDMEEDIIPATPNVVVSSKLNKVRKQKFKTYLDEEGYLVTRKEFGYDTGSEEEAEKIEEKDKKEEEPASKIKKMEPVKPLPATKPAGKKSKQTSPKKQSSLMSFFKKA